MRRPQDTLSQRILVYDLRHAIDRVMKRPWDTVARRHLDALIKENPRSVHSTHVRYNIGVTRRNFLRLLWEQPWEDMQAGVMDEMAQAARVARPLPGQSDPASLAR